MFVSAIFTAILPFHGVQPLMTISMNNYCATTGQKVCEEGGVRTLANEDYSLNVAP
jgi:hypothetical protein